MGYEADMDSTLDYSEMMESEGEPCRHCIVNGLVCDGSSSRCEKKQGSH